MGIFFKDADNPTSDDYDALDDFFMETEPYSDTKKSDLSKTAWQNKNIVFGKKAQEA